MDFVDLHGSTLYKSSDLSLKMASHDDLEVNTCAKLCKVENIPCF